MIEKRRELLLFSLFFFNETATTAIYTLSLHDALPISTFFIFKIQFLLSADHQKRDRLSEICPSSSRIVGLSSGDRKSTRLNSSHVSISYAVFCLKKKKQYTMFLTRTATD